MNKHLEQVSRVTKDCVGFTWKIENFSSLRRQTGEFVRSSVVKCSDAQFCLKLYPNGKIKPNYVDVVLEKVALHSLPSGEYTIGFKAPFGQKRTSFPSAAGTFTSNKTNIESSTAPSSNLEESHAVVTTNESSLNGCTSAAATNSITSSFLSSSTTDSISTSGKTSAYTSTFPVSIPATTYPSSTFGNTSTSTSGFAFPVPATTDSSYTFGKVLASTSTLPVSFPTTTTTTSFSYCSSSKSAFPLTAVRSPRFMFADSVNSKATSVELKKDTEPLITKETNSAVSFSTTSSPNSNLTSGFNSIQSMMPFSAIISTKSPSLSFSEKTSIDNIMIKDGPTLFLETDQGISLPRNLLFDFKNDLFPDDVLTVTCDVKLTTVVNVSESTVVHEDTCSSTGITSLLKGIQYAFENPRFSDVTLKVGDVEFPAHKIILANRSKVFDLMFESGMKESQENVVNLVEMKPATAKEMLRYIYTGKILDMSMDKAADLYAVADRYDMPELKKWCKDFLLQHISPDFVCDVAVLADLHGDEDLKKASKRTIRNNLKTTLNSENWAALSKENPAVYLEMLQLALLDDSL